MASGGGSPELTELCIIGEMVDLCALSLPFSLLCVLLLPRQLLFLARRANTAVLATSTAAARVAPAAAREVRVEPHLCAAGRARTARSDAGRSLLPVLAASAATPMRRLRRAALRCCTPSALTASISCCCRSRWTSASGGDGEWYEAEVKSLSETHVNFTFLQSSDWNSFDESVLLAEVGPERVRELQKRRSKRSKKALQFSYADLESGNVMRRKDSVEFSEMLLSDGKFEPDTGILIYK